MHRTNGFTLVEALIVIFLIVITATFAVPNFIAWRDNDRLRGAATNLKGDLEMAKLKAIQMNGPVAIDFSASSYEIFDDSGASASAREVDEQFFRQRSLPAGIKIDLDHSRKIRFMGRGTAKNGTIYLVNSQGRKKEVIVSRVARIRIK